MSTLVNLYENKLVERGEKAACPAALQSAPRPLPSLAPPVFPSTRYFDAAHLDESLGPLPHVRIVRNQLLDSIDMDFSCGRQDIERRLQPIIDLAE
jgi:hypothetical protein